jgi:hypothetical protein
MWTEGWPKEGREKGCAAQREGLPQDWPPAGLQRMIIRMVRRRKPTALSGAFERRELLLDKL